MKFFATLVLFAIRFRGIGTYGATVRSWIDEAHEVVDDVAALSDYLTERLKAYLDVLGIFFLYEQNPEFWNNLVMKEVDSYKAFKTITLPSPEQEETEIVAFIDSEDFKPILGILRQETRVSLVERLYALWGRRDVPAQAMARVIFAELMEETPSHAA